MYIVNGVNTTLIIIIIGNELEKADMVSKLPYLTTGIHLPPPC